MSDALAPYDEAYFRARYRPEDPPNAYARTLAGTLLDRYSPHRVLDVGCGFGMLLRAFAEAGAEAWGIEGAEAALRLSPARERIRRVDLMRDPFPFPPAHFDLVTCVEVAEHLPGEEPWMTELARVLAPGGRLFLQTPKPGTHAARLDPTHINVRGKRAWVEAFSRRGLRLADEELMEIERRLPVGAIGAKLPAWIRFSRPVQAYVVRTGTRTVFRKA